MSVPRLAYAPLAGLLLATLTGCANHLPEETVNAMDIDRETLHQQRLVQPLSGDPRFIQQPGPAFSATEEQSFRVSTYSVNKTLEVYTPYQPLREIYELPLGVVMSAGGVVFSIVDVIPFFGMLPDVMTTDLLAHGVAGINPLMNIESQARSEKRVLGTPERELIDEKTEQSRLPLRGVPVIARLNGQATTLTTDERGRLNVDLLALATATTAPDELTLSTTGEDGEPIRAAFPLTRQLSVRLQQARKLLDKYQADNTLTDPAEAVKDLTKLSGWGFENEVRDLEQRIRAGLNASQLAEFDRQLVQALAG